MVHASETGTLGQTMTGPAGAVLRQRAAAAAAFSLHRVWSTFGRYCPVTWKEQGLATEGRWDCAAEFCGQLFLLRGAKELSLFLRSPRAFISGRLAPRPDVPRGQRIAIVGPPMSAPGTALSHAAADGAYAQAMRAHPLNSDAAALGAAGTSGRPDPILRVDLRSAVQVAVQVAWEAVCSEEEALGAEMRDRCD